MLNCQYSKPAVWQSEAKVPEGKCVALFTVILRYTCRIDHFILKKFSDFLMEEFRASRKMCCYLRVAAIWIETQILGNQFVFNVNILLKCCNKIFHKDLFFLNMLQLFKSNMIKKVTSVRKTATDSFKWIPPPPPTFLNMLKVHNVASDY